MMNEIAIGVFGNSCDIQNLFKMKIGDHKGSISWQYGGNELGYIVID